MKSLILILMLATGCTAGRYQAKLAVDAQMEREIMALTQRNRIMKERLESCNFDEPPSALYSSLYQVYHSGPVKIKRIGRITEITFLFRDLFSGDGFTIREEMHMHLDVLATALKSNPNYTVRIEGHTDDSPIPYNLRRVYPDSWMYAIGRAARLMDALTGDFGVDETRFALSSRGEFAPRTENDTDGGRMRNNRIVVSIYPKGVEP